MVLNETLEKMGMDYLDLMIIHSPQLCVRYTVQLGTVSLPKTANKDHMKTNADVDFEISAEDMEILKNFKKIENYGANREFPVYGGKL